MKRKDFFKLYTVDHVPGKNGRMKRVHRYIGKKYTVDQAVRKQILTWGWPALALATAAFIGGGFIPASAQMCIYVLPFFAFCILALYFLYTAMITVTGMKQTADETQINDGLKYGNSAGMALMLLGCGWLLASLVYFIIGTPTGPWIAEAGFALCAAVNAVCGWILRSRFHGVTFEEAPEEKDVPEVQNENESLKDGEME